jgi:hypothetical protein
MSDARDFVTIYIGATKSRDIADAFAANQKKS